MSTNPLRITVNSVANLKNVESYGGNQDQPSTGVVNVSNNNNRLTINGNRWQKVEFSDLTITPNTILRFRFSGNDNAQIQGIGFDNDNVVTPNDQRHFFQIAGSQDWGISSENIFETELTNGFTLYEVPVGQFFTGDFKFLTFVNDDDGANPDAQGIFRNVQILEQENDLLRVNIDGQNENKEILSYGDVNQNKRISGTVKDNSNGGNRRQLELEGNGWRKIDITGYEITENTVLNFQFRSNQFGEIHGIGFDNNSHVGNDDRGRFFQVDGTQDWGIQDLDDYILGTTAAGFQRYSIPVGEFFTGEFDFLTFANDHDVPNPTAIGQFQNISLDSTII